MDWTNELIMEFIQGYEKHPILWDYKHPGHKNRNALHDAWTQISNEMSIEVSVAELKKKKESIMSTYRTLRKKVVDSTTTGSGTNDIYINLHGLPTTPSTGLLDPQEINQHL